MNLKHLYYFWKTAKCGGVVRAASALNLTPQTISGQIRLLENALGTQLFCRDGKSMGLTVAGQTAMDYANEMFALGAELEQVIRQQPADLPTSFHVGVSDAIPKSLAYRLLLPAVNIPEPVRIVCREWRIDRLLNELAAHRLDMVITDAPAPTASRPRGYNHRLGGSGVSFFAARALLGRRRQGFPACLDRLPFLLPGEDSSLRRKLEAWLRKHNLRLGIVGEFDDLALTITFGQAGVGAFAVPTLMEDELVANKKLLLPGRTQEIGIEFFGVTVSRKTSHPCVLAIARQGIA